MDTSVANIRSFLGIALDKGKPEVIVDIVKRLKLQYGQTKVRWIAPENFHITIHFLGNITSPLVSSITSSVRDSLVTTLPFNIHLSEAQLFPSRRVPHVIAMPCIPHPALSQLHQLLSCCLNQQGIRTESRPFRPHVTLGRIQHAAFKNEFQKENPLLIPFEVKKVTLFSSHLNASGARYKPLAEIRLGNT